jgi:hypothetical protein
MVTVIEQAAKRMDKELDQVRRDPKILKSQHSY